MKPPKLIKIRLSETIRSFGDISHANHKFFRLLSKSMKLRIRGNSIRFRLTKSEVDQLGRTGKIRECVDFGASPGFCYQLFTTVDDSATRAKFEGPCLSVSIPASEAENWIRSEQVGIEEMQQTQGNNFLRILVEKDFACLTVRAGEDDTDAFPNPFVHGKS